MSLPLYMGLPFYVRADLRVLWLLPDGQVLLAEAPGRVSREIGIEDG